MGLSWQQGPLSGKSVGRFLTPEPLPKRLLFAEPLRRRLRVKLGGEWIADSEDVLVLHEPGRYPVAYFPLADVRPGVLVSENRTTATTSARAHATWSSWTARGVSPTPRGRSCCTSPVSRRAGTCRARTSTRAR